MSTPRLALLCTLLLSLLTACSKRPDPPAVAKTFFEQIAAGEGSAAYGASAFAFQAQQSEQVFTAAVKEMGLLDFASVTADTPTIDGRTAKMKVEVTTKKGVKIPLNMTFNDEGGQWRVFALKSPVNMETGVIDNRFSLVGKGTGFTSAVNQPMPDEKTIRKLVLEALLQFNDAIQQKSFDDFYAEVSRAWQKQLTIGQLTREFQPFVDKGVNIGGISKVEATLSAPPTVTTDGLLIVSGFYPTEPYKVGFSLKFLYELPKWRVFGLDVNIYK